MVGAQAGNDAQRLACSLPSFSISVSKRRASPGEPGVSCARCSPVSEGAAFAQATALRTNAAAGPSDAIFFSAKRLASASPSSRRSRTSLTRRSAHAASHRAPAGREAKARSTAWARFASRIPISARRNFTGIKSGLAASRAAAMARACSGLPPRNASSARR